MADKLPPLPNEAFEHGETETHEIPKDGCSHFFQYQRADVSCKNCHNVWLGLSKFVTITDGKMKLASR